MESIFLNIQTPTVQQTLIDQPIILMTIILGLVIKTFLTNWYSICENILLDKTLATIKNKVKIYFIHILWSFLIFLGAIQYWLQVFIKQGNTEITNIFTFCYHLLPLFLFFFATNFLFSPIEAYLSTKKKKVLEIRISFYVSVILYLCYTIGNNLYFENNDYTLENVFFRSIAIVLIGTGIYNSYFYPQRKIIHYLVFFLASFVFLYFALFREQNIIF